MDFYILLAVTRFDENNSKGDATISLIYEPDYGVHSIEKYKDINANELHNIVNEWEVIAKKLKVRFKLNSFAEMLNDTIRMDPKKFYTVMDIDLD